MRIVFSVLLVLTFIINSNAQNQFETVKPKLVVGIVVDQMRYDYLTRFYTKYGDDGFKRMLKDGFVCENAHFNYVPTYTAVGHTAIYTGTTPSVNGIIGNNWYDKEERKSIYCVDDSNYKTLGAEYGGEKSPARLLTTTITDELHLAQQNRGKVIGISLKDRSAILPAGHTANAAYWFEGRSQGKFISSTYYMAELPKWVQKFNEKGYAEKYLKEKWETLYPIKKYTESIEDDNDFEQPFKGQSKAVFPYDLKELSKENGGFDILKSSPFGNTILVDFAKEAITQENLGKSEDIDFLAISFSSPDYIGHQFGVDSKEVEDTYLRLDKDLAELLKYLDKEVGTNKYTVFLTADHAAVQVPAYLNSLKIPGGYFSSIEFEKFIGDFCQDQFGSAKLIEDFSNFQIFLNKDELKHLKLETEEVAEALVNHIMDYPKLMRVITSEDLLVGNFNDRLFSFLQNGFNQKRSGDVILVPNPAVISYPKQGSTHGSGFTYDTHVPILFFGTGINNAKTSKFVPITSIAPTLANLLQISFPNGNSGNIIEGVIK